MAPASVVQEEIEVEEEKCLREKEGDEEEEAS
jgi:hypothetical protein